LIEWTPERFAGASTTSLRCGGSIGAIVLVAFGPRVIPAAARVTAAVVVPTTGVITPVATVDDLFLLNPDRNSPTVS